MQDVGTLYIVATPIGNLEDITQRALRILKDVDVIAAEDTRHSQKLLQQYEISTKLISLHDHNEAQRGKQLVERMRNGENVALISDAGTPLISDPGYTLVNYCRDAGVKVVPIPGACAAITALCAAGLATDKFIFEGFLPVKQQAKEHALSRLIKQTATTIFYESPRRIEDTVSMISEVLGADRQLVVAKELTKTFETFYADEAQNVLSWLQRDPNHQRGEFVLMVAGVENEESDIPEEAESLLLLLCDSLPLKKAAAIVATHYTVKKNALYQRGLALQGKD
ncbi:16S rRNA (cytidine(1402)-2'-O)-methyltransferase [Aestuariibacter sp. AA17]|uniref:Ribosomal RNA small subunit methyltransferase I n=1 Tax=Fluctibacter corallii TaxID=2984329 RepID=A0ABT3A4C9_9ALTE|nr:16S rRNA (cytidine(1402)-2'-O)-methyltransferase [Aestuariibacter sp. AA17]MCV2883523.1 16S rRNA (cytidine(1402)-2'-O)-methyltransferase [Aestuariibacter sp. AA17]